jgi:PAS domain S-box-containing protein
MGFFNLDFMDFFPLSHYPHGRTDDKQRVWDRLTDMEEIPGLSNYRVLIVDDDYAHAEMVREFLTISGLGSVAYAENVRRLWELLKESDYDIVLLDYKLPDGNGLDVLTQMHERALNIPVVMVTGQGNERIAVQAIQRGAADYLIKSGDYLITLPSLIRKTVNAAQLQLSVQRSLEQIRYQAMLLNHVRDAVVVWDMAGTITYWNPAAEALFGWSAETRLGQPVAEIYLKTFTPPIAPPTGKETPGLHVVRKFVNREGRTIYVSSQVTALSDAQAAERLIGFMDVSHDITARVEAEQALRASEARYRAIVEDYQTELISRFKPNGTLTFVNEVFCRYFEKARDELLGMNFLFFVPESDREKVIQHLLAFKPERPVASLEHQVRLPDQGMRWLMRTDRAIFGKDGRVLEFQSVGRDITLRKQLESQLQAIQAHLIQAARMATIGEVASGVAHQIYNPLTTIIADAQILLRQLPADQRERESAEAIEQAGWRLQRVVQQLMEFSRPASETLVSLSVNDTIQQALSLVTMQIEAAGIRLEVTLSEEPLMVHGSEGQLENLWINLILLARDACLSDQGHTIWVSSHREADGRATVEIRDDGKPIPAGQLGSIFEPDFAGQAGGRGTGMELSVCREIVRQHGGQISAESSPGHDTIFRVLLPAEV